MAFPIDKLFQNYSATLIQRQCRKYSGKKALLKKLSQFRVGHNVSRFIDNYIRNSKLPYRAVRSCIELAIKKTMSPDKERTLRQMLKKDIRELYESLPDSGAAGDSGGSKVESTDKNTAQLSESMQRMTLGIGDSTADGESKGGVNVGEAVTAILAEFGINGAITDETERLQYASLFLRIKNPETEERKLPEDVEELVNYIHQLLPEGEDPVSFLNLDISLESSFHGTDLRVVKKSLANKNRALHTQKAVVWDVSSKSRGSFLKTAAKGDDQVFSKETLYK